ncbi:hypothetical protein BGZ76_006360, partial [Entomortierella beljakovae]
MAKNAEEQRHSGQLSYGLLEPTVQEPVSPGLPLVTSSSTQTVSSTVGQMVNVTPS